MCALSSICLEKSANELLEDIYLMQPKFVLNLWLEHKSLQGKSEGGEKYMKS